MIMPKCNVDAARRVSVCFAAVIPDCQGRLVKCFSGFVNAYFSPCLAEAFAIRRRYPGLSHCN